MVEEAGKGRHLRRTEDDVGSVDGEFKDNVLRSQGMTTCCRGEGDMLDEGPMADAWHMAAKGGVGWSRRRRRTQPGWGTAESRHKGLDPPSRGLDPEAQLSNPP